MRETATVGAAVEGPTGFGDQDHIVGPGMVQRLDHGRVLVLELLEIARRWGCMAVFLEVEQDNAAALALYRSMGFVPVGERRHYYGTGRHAVTMRCRLREPMGSLPLDGGAP